MSRSLNLEMVRPLDGQLDCPKHSEGLIIYGSSKGCWGGDSVFLMACRSCVTPDKVWMRLGHGGFIRDELVRSYSGHFRELRKGESIKVL